MTWQGGGDSCPHESLINFKGLTIISVCLPSSKARGHGSYASSSTVDDTAHSPRRPGPASTDSDGHVVRARESR